jgi:hypothetical protein
VSKPVAGEFLTAASFVPAGLQLLLAAVLAVIKFENRLNRSFALYLFIEGLFRVLNAATRLGGVDRELMFTLTVYPAIATPFALGYFLLLYTTARPATQRLGGLLILGGLAVCTTWYMVDHAAAFDAGTRTVGPLRLVMATLPLGWALAGLLVLRPSTSFPRRRAQRAVAFAFFLLALLEAVLILTLLQDDAGLYGGFTRNFWIVASRWAVILAAPLALAGLGMLIRDWGTSRGLGVRIPVVVVVAMAMIGTAWYFATRPSTTSGYTLGLAVIGAWRLLAAVIISYALISHRFLDLDLRVRWTISRGTLLAIFAAVFIIVFQVVENQLDAKYGIWTGGIATGILLLAVKPLERFTDRVANSIIPHRRDGDDPLALYRDQAELVWADGVMGRKERLLLDQLRDRLRIVPHEAARIEHEVVSRNRSPVQAGRGKTGSKYTHHD